MTPHVWKSVALVATGILIGCAVGVGGSAVAQAPPRSPTAPGAHYEYFCQRDVSARIWEPEVVEYLNRMGTQGWRLLEPRYAIPGPGPYLDVYCFERISP